MRDKVVSSRVMTNKDRERHYNYLALSKYRTIIDPSNLFDMKLNIQALTDVSMSFEPLKEAIGRHFLDLKGQGQRQRQDLEIDVHFADEATMIRLNKDFRGEDYLTDVLSFSYLEDIRDEETLAGEIFISPEKALVQAKQKRNDIETELYYLIAHGYLHIVGYLHGDDQQEDWILKNSIGRPINR